MKLQGEGTPYQMPEEKSLEDILAEAPPLEEESSTDSSVEESSEEEEAPSLDDVEPPAEPTSEELSEEEPEEEAPDDADEDGAEENGDADAEQRKAFWLGVACANLDEVREDLDLDEDVVGVVVRSVIDDSPAEIAGIKPTEVLIAGDHTDRENVGTQGQRRDAVCPAVAGDKRH